MALSVFKLSLFNLRQRTLTAVLTGFLVALGVGLVAGIWALQRHAERSFQQSLGRFHLLIGPKGSGLQLVLNACFHVDKPVGTIPLEYFRRLAKDPRIASAWPFVSGDSFHGYHLVGTEAAFLEEFQFRGGEKFRFLGAGRPFRADFEAVLGSQVATGAGLSVGDKFVATHGMSEDGHVHDESTFTVVGVLEDTFTPHDRAIYCNLESVYILHVEAEHEDDHAHEKPAGKKDEPKVEPKVEPAKDAKKEQPRPAAKTHDHHHHHHKRPEVREADRKLAAVMVLLKNPVGVGELHREINDGKDAMAVYPAKEINDLFTLIGTANQILVGVSYLVLLSAGVSILATMYNSMSERRRDIAIFRALGGPPGAIFRMIVTESAVICAVGAFAGLIGSYGLLWGAGPLVRGTFGVSVQTGMPEWPEFALLGGAVALGVVSGLLPAIIGYRTDVTTNLRPVN
jgi:putative ABC transport system permease protein